MRLTKKYCEMIGEVDNVDKDRISIEKAMEILKNGGLDVTKEQAKLIVDFLYKLADISLTKSMVKPS